MFPAVGEFLTDLKRLRQVTRSADLLRGVALISKSISTKSNGQVAVFNTVRSYINIQLCVEFIFALKLRERGYQVYILYDDGILNHHDTLTHLDYKPYRAVSKFRWICSLRLLKKLPVIGKMLTPYSDFLSKDEAELIASEISDHVDRDLEPYVEASLVRFYLSAPDKKLLKSEPDYDRAQQLFVSNTKISQAVASSVINKLNPALMITSHGIYSTWGGFMDKMKKSGVRTICWGSNGYNPDKIDIAVNDIAANKADGGFFEHLAGIALPQKEFINHISEQMSQMLDSRINGTASDIARLGLNNSNKCHPILDRIVNAKNNGKKVFALFPNVMWDNATTFKEWNRVFESPVEWIIETVKYFMESNDKLLVVRVHPAEYSWLPVRKGVKDILAFYLGDEILKHENIIFVSPEEKFSSYLLFEHLNGATVYNGTIGPELIYAGIPLILGARAAYSDKGFTFDPQNKQEYFNCYDNPQDILTIQNESIDRIMLFIYEYFTLHGVRLKFLDNQTSLLPAYNAEPSIIWNDAGLEHAVATIVGEREYFQVIPDEISRPQRTVS